MENQGLYDESAVAELLGAAVRGQGQVLTVVRRAGWCLLALWLVGSLTSAAAAGQPLAESSRGRIEGRILADGAPLPGVTVVVNDTSITAITDDEGRFALADVAAGTQSLTLVLGERIALIEPVVVAAAATTTVEHVVEWTAGFSEALVVNGPSRQSERIIEAPGAVTRVGADEIARRASHGQLPRVLEFTPGVQVTQSGVYDYNLNTRGFNSSLNRRVAVLVDGRDPSIQLLGSPEWGANDFPLDDIASVELLRGPSAALYGANASSGVLNLTTRRPRDSRGGTARITLGQLDTVTADLRWAAGLGRGWFVKAVGTARSHGDYAESRVGQVEYSVPCTPGVAGDCLPTERVPLARDRTRAVSGALRVDKYLPRDLLLTMEGGVADLSGPVAQTGIGRAQFLEVRRPWGRVDLSTPRWTVLASYMERNAPRQVALTTGANLAVDSSRSQVEAQANDAIAGGRLRYVAGVSATREALDSADPETALQTVLSEPVTSHREAVFGQLDWPLHRLLKVVVAGRVDANTLHETRFSPKAALVFAPRSAHALRLTYNQAFQVPNYSEFFLQADAAPAVSFAALEALCTPFGVSCGLDRTRVLAVGNRDLQVETISTVEAGYKGVVGRRAFVTADYYRNRASNFVTDLLPQLGTSLGRVNPAFGRWQAPAGLPSATAEAIRALAPATLSNAQDGRAILAVASYTNLGVVKAQGVDLGVHYYVTTGWRVAASYSWLQVEIEAPPPGLDALLLPNAPAHSGSTGVSYAAPRYDVAADLRWSDGFRWSVGVFQGPVPAYTTADLAANYRLSPRLAIGVHAANLFDHRHWQAFGGDLLRRRVLAHLRLDW